VADAARYLLPTERAEITIRRHWAVVAGVTVQTVLLLTIGVLLARVLGSVDFAQMVLVYFCLFVLARWIWALVDWRHETLVVTDKRLLLLTGIFSRNVAIMPLVKVTDLTFNRSATGLMLGYGKFVVESAGQDQALSTIDYVPQPEKLYIQISELLFGGDKGSPGAMVTAAQREAEEEAERAARRRWRKFTRKRTDGPVDERPGGSAQPSQLDAILADRDTLLADRDDPDRWQDERGWGGPVGRDDLRDTGDFGDEPYRRPARDLELPRIHEPRRGERGEAIEPQSPLPPPRRPRDSPPPGVDPADD
jgi:membrane protein YdbS with pleckstrin-like domain